MTDAFDPPFEWPAREWRIYGNDHATLWALVDEIDYQWALQWRWNPKPGRRGFVYLRRACGGHNGKWGRGPVWTEYLHVEIMKRTGIKQPSHKHRLVDHGNGDTLDCRRYNLSWTTHQGNARNRHYHRKALDNPAKLDTG